MKDKQITMDDQNIEIDIIETGKDAFHIIWRGKCYIAEIVKTDLVEKQVGIRINNQLKYFKGRNKINLLLEKMGLNNGSATKNKEVKAPMPGLIVSILVAPGDQVKKGDPVIILEAMKMENILKSPNDGIVQSVRAEIKQTVDKNQVLLSFE